MPGFLNDRRDLRVGQEFFEALLIPVEEHPDPVGVNEIAIDGRTLGPVLFSLFGALGREDFQEAVEVFDLRRCEHHVISPLLRCRSDLWSVSSRFRGVATGSERKKAD